MSSRGILKVILVIGSLLTAVGCNRSDPWARMDSKYDELIALVRKHRSDPERSVSEAEAWFRKAQPEMAAICEEQRRLKEKPSDEVRRAALRHTRHAMQKNKEIDAEIQSWGAQDKLSISALLVDLSQVCMPDAEKVQPFR